MGERFTGAAALPTKGKETRSKKVKLRKIVSRGRTNHFTELDKQPIRELSPENDIGRYTVTDCTFQRCTVTACFLLPAALRAAQFAGILFTQRPILSLFAPQGRHVAQMA